MRGERAPSSREEQGVHSRHGCPEGWTAWRVYGVGCRPCSRFQLSLLRLSEPSGVGGFPCVFGKTHTTYNLPFSPYLRVEFMALLHAPSLCHHCPVQIQAKPGLPVKQSPPPPSPAGAVCGPLPCGQHLRGRGLCRSGSQWQSLGVRSGLQLPGWLSLRTGQGEPRAGEGGPRESRAGPRGQGSRAPAVLEAAHPQAQPCCPPSSAATSPRHWGLPCSRGAESWGPPGLSSH